MPTPTATEIYETHQREIAALIEFLHCELEAHAERAREKGIHWGMVGDLEHARKQIKQTLISVMGAHDEEATGQLIEDALADASA